MHSVTKSPKATRILLAEDMETNQFVVTPTLARAGYACDIVGNGREALAAVVRKDYDVVLMDCQMPEMSGFEAAAGYPAQPRKPAISADIGPPSLR